MHLCRRMPNAFIRAYRKLIGDPAGNQVGSTDR